MSPVIIGIILIFLGLCLIPIGYSEFKEELKGVKEEKSVFKRLIVYVITFIGFLDFNSYLGWILSLALLLVFSGGAFIILTILQ
jgi:xanthine/uracil permease